MVPCGQDGDAMPIQIFPCDTVPWGQIKTFGGNTQLLPSNKVPIGQHFTFPMSSLIETISSLLMGVE